MRKKLLGEDYLVPQSSINNVALTYMDLARIDEAIKYTKNQENESL